MNQKRQEGLWEYFAKSNDTFYGVLIIAAVILAIAGFLVYINFGAFWFYAGAKYKTSVECTLVNITEYDKEQEVPDAYYWDESPVKRKEHTKTEQYTLYALDWEYTINDEKEIYKEVIKYYNPHQIGDHTTIKLYSQD